MSDWRRFALTLEKLAELPGSDTTTNGLFGQLAARAQTVLEDLKILRAALEEGAMLPRQRRFAREIEDVAVTIHCVGTATRRVT